METNFNEQIEANSGGFAPQYYIDDNGYPYQYVTEYGEPVFCIDDYGNPIVYADENGYPVDEYGNPLFVSYLETEQTGEQPYTQETDFQQQTPYDYEADNNIPPLTDNTVNSANDYPAQEYMPPVEDDTDYSVSEDELNAFIQQSNALKEEHETLANRSVLEKIIDKPEVDKAIRTTYQNIKNNKFEKKPSKANKKKKKEKHDLSQNLVPIDRIVSGIIHTTTGRYIKILEILPINFEDKIITTQNSIVRNFASLFHNCPSKIHLKCITDKNNPSRLIQFIKESCEDENEQRGASDNLIACAQDKINRIISLSEDDSLMKRYFLIFPYDGKSTNVEEIVNDMYISAAQISSVFSSLGNTIVEYNPNEASFMTGEILYYFFNRQTSRKESFNSRVQRIVSDVDIYKSMGGSDKSVALDVDYLAPKTTRFFASDCMYIDGTYKTFFVLKENGHPAYAYPGWLDNFTFICPEAEVDVYIERLNHDATMTALENYDRISLDLTDSRFMSSETKKNIFNQSQYNQYILNKMKQGEDVFNVVIMVTISADSIGSLMSLKKYVLKEFNRQHIEVEKTFENSKKMFMATTPLYEIDRAIFNRNKRNYLTSSLEALYMFTSFSVYDPKGYALGINMDNHSITSINPFNTSMFPNANISVFGMTGAGKTFSTQVLARAIRICGTRVFFILPMKAHEYYRGCKEIGGEFVKLVPGSSDCINICEIRPEISVDKNIMAESNFAKASFLSKKISSLITWIQLNMLREPMTMDEADLCEAELSAMYADYGITNDNDSIFYEDGTLKPMPIIGDMYDRFMDIDELKRVGKAIQKYVTGACKNLNGETNIDVTNKMMCIDVDESTMSKDLLPAFTYMAIDFVYSLVKENRLYNDIIFFDEIWKLLEHPASAEQIKDMVKIIRGYGGSFVPITQDINDYLNSAVGKAILSGTAIKLIMYLEETECRTLAEQLNLSERDIEDITSFGRGEALLLTNRIKTKIKIAPSEKELMEFTTDPNELRKYFQVMQEDFSVS